MTNPTPLPTAPAPVQRATLHPLTVDVRFNLSPGEHACLCAIAGQLSCSPADALAALLCHELNGEQGKIAEIVASLPAELFQGGRNHG